MSDDCPTCSGTGLVEPTEEYNAGGLGWARCPDCEPPPPDPQRVAELKRIHEIQSGLFERVTEAGEGRMAEPTLRERLAQQARAVSADQIMAAKASRREAAEKYERNVVEGAKAFYDARMEHLPELLAGAAAKGRFQWEVWRFDATLLQGSALDIKMRGLQMVADWLEEQGFDVDLRDDKENAPDYGYQHTVVLTALWDDPVEAGEG